MLDTFVRRRWFQFRLSTAIALMFVAGGFIWANSRWRLGDIPYEAFSAEYEDVETEVCGWPYPFAVRLRAVGTDPHNPIFFEAAAMSGLKRNLVLDCFIGLTAIVGIGWACETVLRRREVRTS